MKDYSFLKKSLTEKLKCVRQGKYEELPKEYRDVYENIFSPNDKSEVLKIGTNLLIYLLDVIIKDPEIGAHLIGYLSVGYPNKKSTDLYFSIYDCVNLQRLYINSSREFGFKNFKTQGLIINAYFRWYCSAYETFRKLLIFCLYCNKIKTGQNFSNIDDYLFGVKNPAATLNAESPKNQIEPILKYYNGEIRHSISHSNICIIKGDKEPNLFSILLRETAPNKNETYERYFENIVDFAKSTQHDISVLYQSMRLFIGVANSYIINCYGDDYKNILGDSIQISPYHARMIKDGPLYE